MSFLETHFSLRLSKVGGRSFSRKQILVTLSLLGLVVVLGFQNCAPGFEVAMKDSGPAPLGGECEGLASCQAPEPGPSPAVMPTLVDRVEAIQLAPTTYRSFSDTRIFQRMGSGEALVHLSLRGDEPESRYLAVFLLNEAGGVVERLSVSETKPGQPINGLMPHVKAAGMVYRRLRVSFYAADGNEVARWTSPRFAVGEVFLAAGQSNAATHGETRQTSAIAMNRMVNPQNQEWLPLRDPMPVATNWSEAEFGGRAEPGGSPWPIFADALSQDLGVPVAIVSVGYGGTSSAQWQKGNARGLYPRLISAASALSGCSFRAVLWHQGESDAIDQVTTATYVARMRALQQDFRNDSGCTTTPWVVAQAAWVPLGLFPSASNSSIAAIASAQRMLWQVPGFAQGPNTDQWTASPALRFDQVHFTATGLGLHGRAWRDRVRAVFSL